MKVLLAIPRYRFIWPSAEQWLVEAIGALSFAGHEVDYFPGDQLQGLYYDLALERACQAALEGDLLLTCDQDQYLSGPDSLRLAEDCLSGGWALLAAPYVCRGRGDPSWQHPDEGQEPSPQDLDEMRIALVEGKPLECRGFVGSGTAAVSTKALKTIPRPWWFRSSPEPFGEDVWFARRARKAGHRVGVHFGLRSAEHWGARVYRAERMLAGIEEALGVQSTEPVH